MSRASYNLLILVVVLGSVGRDYNGTKGMILFPVFGAMAFFLVDFVGTALMVRKYYWNNPHRSRWNAFCYLQGWTQEGDK